MNILPFIPFTYLEAQVFASQAICTVRKKFLTAPTDPLNPRKPFLIQLKDEPAIVKHLASVHYRSQTGARSIERQVHIQISYAASSAYMMNDEEDEIGIPRYEVQLDPRGGKLKVHHVVSWYISRFILFFCAYLNESASDMIFMKKKHAGVFRDAIERGVYVSTSSGAVQWLAKVLQPHMLQHCNASIKSYKNI